MYHAAHAAIRIEWTKWMSRMRAPTEQAGNDPVRNLQIVVAASLLSSKPEAQLVVRNPTITPTRTLNKLLNHQVIVPPLKRKAATQLSQRNKKLQTAQKTISPGATRIK